MTKDVLITVRGLQFDRGGTDADNVNTDKANTGEGNTATIETMLPGAYYEKNGSHYILYEEMMEGFREPTKNKIKFGEHFLELDRSGPVNVRMVFDENKKTMSNYNTPYGNIPIGIDTKKIHITKEPDRITVDVDYMLEAHNEYLADYRILIDIRSKESIKTFT